MGLFDDDDDDDYGLNPVRDIFRDSSRNDERRRSHQDDSDDEDNETPPRIIRQPTLEEIAEEKRRYAECEQMLNAQQEAYLIQCKEFNKKAVRYACLIGGALILGTSAYLIAKWSRSEVKPADSPKQITLPAEQPDKYKGK